MKATDSVTTGDMSNTSEALTGQSTALSVLSLLATAIQMLQISITLPDMSVPHAPPLGWGLQQMAIGVDINDVLTLPHRLPPSQVPPIYTASLAMDGNRAYSTA